MANIKFIHIGHHKCGSTFLQRAFFSKLTDLNTLTEVSFAEYAELQDLIHQLCHKSDLYYDEESVGRALEKVLENFDSISYEGFVGHGLEKSDGLQIEPIARRLQRLCAPCKVLFVIRNQETFFPSLYKSEVQIGMVAGFEFWMKRKQQFALLDWARYAPIVELYQRLFGKENVVVVPYERLFDGKALGELPERLGISSEGIEAVDPVKRVNRGLSGPRLALTKLANRLVGSKFNYGNRHLYYLWRRHSEIVDAVAYGCGAKPPSWSFVGYEAMLESLFHEDNLRTSELIGEDLGALGYP